jgi:lipid II:glycine glycyltransferase (peptidoglycan interpeptide bridge formation enzyme)
MSDIREYRLEGRLVAAVLSFYFRDQVLPYYGASDPSYNSFSPNNFMYFDLMRRAGSTGFRVFDFGRSKKNQSGSYDFKAHWGMEERPLPYEMILVKRKTLPNFSPANPAYQVPIRIWQHVPLPVTRALGPSLIRLVP